MNAWADWLAGGWGVAAASLLAGALIGCTHLYAKLYVKRKMRRIKLQLQEVCPHADYMHGVVHSMFARNHRTTNYHCAACGAVLRDRVQVEEALEYWTENIEEFERRRRQCLEMIDKFSP